MWRRFGLVAVLMTFASVALAQQKVSIGVVTAMSGPLAAPGKFQLNGFRLAEEEINQAGGVSVGGR
jgi:branched-chain amino acid transport system substrate-binding protein